MSAEVGLRSGVRADETEEGLGVPSTGVWVTFKRLGRRRGLGVMCCGRPASDLLIFLTLWIA
jgi:hypothetical protein